MLRDRPIENRAKNRTIATDAFRLPAPKYIYFQLLHESGQCACWHGHFWTTIQMRLCCFFFIRPLFYCTGWLSHKNFHGRSLMHMHTHADNSYEKWPKPAFRWHNKEIKITILFIDFVRWISSLGWAKKHCFTHCMCGGDEWKTNGMIIKFETITKNVIIMQNKSHFNAAKLKEVSTESRESTHFNKMWPFLHFL